MRRPDASKSSPNTKGFYRRLNPPGGRHLISGAGFQESVPAFPLRGQSAVGAAAGFAAAAVQMCVGWTD